MGISTSRIANRGKPAPAPAVPPKPPGKAPAPPGASPKPAPSMVSNLLVDIPITTITQATVTASCGHSVTFGVNVNKPEGAIAAAKAGLCDKCRRAAKIARKAAKREADHAAKHPEQPRPREGDPGDLPVGAKITLIRLADGTWAGICEALGLIVETEAVGPRRQVPWLAAAWVDAKKAADARTETKDDHP